MLAAPVIAAAYGAAFASRIWAGVRPVAAAVLGMTVIGSVYADVALSHAPARVTPLRGAAVMALAITLLGAGVAPAPTTAHQPAEAVVAAARSYIDVPYRLGAEGPNRFDCSGLMFRIFADAGELPRISGRRLRAVGYLRWFSARGLASKNHGQRGDMVVYGDGAHIGLYLGDDKVLSALLTGVTVHPLHGINLRFTAFLNVQWGKGDGTGKGDDGDGNGGDEELGPDGDDGAGNQGRRGNRGNRGDGGENAPADLPVDGEDGATLPAGLTTGTLNLRKAPGPDEKIIGWVSRGSTFSVIGTGNSPSGALWLNIEMANGKTGWIWAHWTSINEG